MHLAITTLSALGAGLCCASAAAWLGTVYAIASA
jgi:hypothetical protein